MGAFRFLGMAAIIYTAVLLAMSFFVLFANRKVDTRGLKIFGYIVAAFLCVAAAVVFTTGIYISLRGRQPMMMQDMMRSQMQQPMMRH